MKAPVLITLLIKLFLISALSPAIRTHLFNGCSIDENLCGDGEMCIEDGLLGECYDGTVNPLTYNRKLKDIEAKLIQLQLHSNDYNFKNAKTQCILIYFKLATILQLQFDENFCEVQNPHAILTLLQEVKASLLSQNDSPVHKALSDINKNAKGLALQFGIAELGSEITDESGRDEIDAIRQNMFGEENSLTQMALPNEVRTSEVLPDSLSLSTDKLMDQDENLVGEEEKMVPINMISDDDPPLKKDVEYLGNSDQGLENKEHIIVKVSKNYRKVDSSRVYAKVSMNLTEEQLIRLINYLIKVVAAPNNMIFNEFEFHGDQLSFTVRHMAFRGSKLEKRFDASAGVVQLVYKRRKEIESISGIHVDETGIGSEQDTVPLESKQSDIFMTSIIIMSLLAIVLVLIVFVVQKYKTLDREAYSNKLFDTVKQSNGAPSAAYQELCRNRVSHENSHTSQTKSISTSSWNDEPISECNMDISTGHVILEFLKKFIHEPAKIDKQWEALSGYMNQTSSISVALLEENRNKNRNENYLPYDETLITLRSITDESGSKYINASAIYDADPKQANYIAAQAPLPNTISAFWQMIWEQGSVLIINLTTEDDFIKGQCTRYWPENGLEIYGRHEVHLVSEHIWSEDYLVRSFYLKNLETNETRTVTQFHHLTWPEHDIPNSVKALLEFRRKVNKSYRGRAAPLIVHCTCGTGRTGTYCLLDIVLNRINKGIKELNIAGSLEFLRDQRAGMVESAKQYKMIFSCVAEEVTTMVRALQR